MAKVYFYYSSMNSGKTTSLLQATYNYLERGMPVLLLKPRFDIRDGEEPVISSRIGLKMHCQFFPETREELDALFLEGDDNVRAIFVDEVQFVDPGLLKYLIYYGDTLDIPLLCYGLRNSYDGAGFPASDWLLRHADKLVEMKSICWCGKKATHNMMVIDGKPVVKTLAEGNKVVGGNELYHAVCRCHFELKMYKED